MEIVIEYEENRRLSIWFCSPTKLETFINQPSPAGIRKKVYKVLRAPDVTIIHTGSQEVALSLLSQYPAAIILRKYFAKLSYSTGITRILNYKGNKLPYQESVAMLLSLNVPKIIQSILRCLAETSLTHEEVTEIRNKKPEAVLNWLAIRKMVDTPLLR